MGWWKYVGSDGEVIGMNSFGASGRAADLFEHFGFTSTNVADTVKVVIAKNADGAAL